MSLYLKVYFEDANQLQSVSGMWIHGAGDVDAVLAGLKAASNARIKRALLSTPVPLQTITNNTAAAANVETVKTKAVVQLRGADSGSLALPFARVKIGIPAPVGTLINGASGDVSDAEVQSLKVKVLSESGVQMDTVEKIYYSS